jgi:hypothetical protein
LFRASQGGFVGDGKGVEVALGRGDLAVAEAFLHHLKVSTAGEEPGGMGVAEVMDSGRPSEVGSVSGGVPAMLAEPVGGDVRVGVDNAGPARVVFAFGLGAGAVGGVGGSAAVALALAEVVGRDRSVGVGAAVRRFKGEGLGIYEFELGASSRRRLKKRSSGPRLLVSAWALSLTTIWGLSLKRRHRLPLG